MVQRTIPLTVARWSARHPAPPTNVGPPWPNGQGAPLLRVRLWVRVPLGVAKKYFFFSTAGPKRAKSTTPCGIQTHNLQIRSLTRCSVAPTGQPLGQTSVPALGFHFFFCLAPTARRCAAHNAPDKNKIKNDGAYAPGGTRTPDPGLIRPMLYQTELPEQHPPHTWDRTKDLHIISQTLTQLSYMGTYRRSPRNW